MKSNNPIFVNLEFITGLMVGAELFTDEDSNTIYFLLDLGIIRLIFIKVN